VGVAKNFYEAATIEGIRMKEKAARQVEMDRERMRWELRQAYGNELSHFFMIRAKVEG
jgi:hypothetical protein